MEVLYENFPSLENLVSVLAQRPNNECMRGEHASDRRDVHFFGSHSYKEAVEIMRTGYDEAAKKLKTDVRQKNKIQGKYMAMVKHPIPHNAVVGYIPNVPNAIRNIPESMITKDLKPVKRKTIRILFSQCGNCGRNTDWFSNAGAALLSAVELIEKSGIQTRIDLVFMAAQGYNQLAFPTVKIKNYDERYSFQKVSFPLVHPSMFRRIGFKWLETSPQVNDDRYPMGYGHTPSMSTVTANVKLNKDCYYIDTEWIQEHNCSVEEILKRFEVIT